MKLGEVRVGAVCVESLVKVLGGLFTLFNPSKIGPDGNRFCLYRLEGLEFGLDS